MPRSNKIEITLALNTKQSAAALNRFNKKMKGTFTSMTAASKKSSGAIAANFKGLAAVLAGLGLGKVAKGIIKTSVQFDRCCT